MAKIKLVLSPGHQLLFLLVIAFLLNINTLFNQYAVDDAIVLTNNTFVQKGINGIPDILCNDYFKGLGGLKGNELSGGRYRPMALVVFAIEYQLFGAKPMISHAINLLFFFLLIYLLFRFLRTYLLKEQHPYLAFFTCLLFIAHPIHTEVIANVKSRDELIAFIFIVVSAIAFIKHQQKKSFVHLSMGLLCFFFALLTKESSVVFIAVLPLFLYYFYHQPIRQSLSFSLPLLVVFTLYMGIRYLVIGFHFTTSNLILNTPYLFATTSEAFATKVYIILKYILLLLFPHPLTSDYSYNQIPYIAIQSVWFVLSLFIIIVLLVISIKGFRNKSLVSFCIFFFCFTLFLVLNLVVNIGAPMAERLLFQPSLAFCLVLAYFYLHATKKFLWPANLALTTLLVLYSIKTISRNAEWKNNDSLYLADVVTSPNSLRTNMYAAETYLNQANAEQEGEAKNKLFSKSAYYGQQAVRIYPSDAFCYMNLGSAQFGLGEYAQAADCWLKAYQLDTTDQEAIKATAFISNYLLKQGNGWVDKGNTTEAIKAYLKSTQLNPRNVDAWYNLGGNYYLVHDTIHANNAWKRVKTLAPDYHLNIKDFY